MKQTKTEILYGIHPVREALKAGRRRVDAIYLAREKPSPRISELLGLAQRLEIPIHRLFKKQILSLAGTDTHQGVAAQVSPYPAVDLSEIVGNHDDAVDPPLYLMIDTVVDPRNLGALIRTALCAGVTGVVIPKDRSAAPTPVVSKASAGALEHIRLARVTNLTKTIKDLKKSNTWIIGLDQNADRSIYEIDFTDACALVVGSEEAGIRPLVKKNCDMLGFIPQSGPVASLNASVAGGIAMYEAYRRRMAESSRPAE